MPQKKTKRSTRTRPATDASTRSRAKSRAAHRTSSAGKREAGSRSTRKRGIHARFPWKEEPNPYLEVRESAIQGKGAFAIRNIRKGTRLIEYLGQRISWRTADKRYDDEKMGRHHTFLFTVDDKTCIDAAVNGNDARFLNHSCDGNCEAITDRKRIFIEARRNIRAGEELLYDYQYERTEDHTEEDEKFYACRCGSPNCRGTILAPKKEE
jgi:SET domain-containing protein